MDIVAEHVKEFINKDKRIDGRGLTDYREVEIEYGVSETAEGSARVKIGDTEVIAGVKLALEKPYPDTPEDGGLMVSTEMLPLANPEFESGPPGIEAIELSRVTDRAIREGKAIDTKELCVDAGEKAWFVSVDICPINADGNLFDAASVAAIAALKDTKFPEMEDGVVNYKKKSDKALPMKSVPLSVTIHKINGKFLIDPTQEEEKASELRLTIGVKEDGELCSMQKGGTLPFTAEDIIEIAKLAVQKTGELRSKL